jgi:hypothetical protein
MAALRCPSSGTITGTTKVVERGLPTGPIAEQTAIHEAQKQAKIDADLAMKDVRCAGPCTLSWKPPEFRVRSSGSQNNPAFPIVGAATVEWTIFPVCARKAGGVKPIPVKPPKNATNVALTAPGPGDLPFRPRPDQSPPKFEKTIPCGKITVWIAHEPGILDGSIVLDFVKTPSELCNCNKFGWIQHFRRGEGGWRYDNGVQPSTTNRRIGALSDPTSTIQPTGGGSPDDNPWYGVATDPAKAPSDFDRNPQPQARIGDKPDDPNTTYVSQLVCVDDGEVLFSWFWGPVPDGNTPLEDVPMKQTPPP